MNNNLFLVQWHLLFFILGIEIKKLHCILPPSYVVDLRDRQIFEISSDEDYDENENEMLQMHDLGEIESLAEDEAKYRPLHHHVENYNRRAAKEKVMKISRNSHFHPIIERNIIDDPRPYISGFKEALDKIKYETPENFPKRKKRSSLKDTTIESTWKKLFFATPKNKNKGYVNINNKKTSKINNDKNNGKRVKRNDDENSIESTEPDFFQGSDENSTPGEYFSTQDSTNFPSNQFTKFTTKKFDDSTTTNESSNDDYDYEKLRVEYYQQIEEMMRKTELFIYTEPENFQETTTIVANNKSLEENKNDVNNKSLNTINVVETKNTSLEANKSLNAQNENFVQPTKNVKRKKPLNCTKVESFLIGPKTLECLSNAYKSIKGPLDLMNALKRTWNVTKFWIILYISVSVACWCQKGWCCCCCCCEFCYPEEVMLREKKCFAENPPGIFVKKEKDGELLKIDTEEYEPTLFETDAYEQMESQIRNL